MGYPVAQLVGQDVGALNLLRGEEDLGEMVTLTI